MKKFLDRFRRLGTPARVLVVIALLNFFAFFVECQVLGGDALNGHMRAGHYYLANHGKLTETTAAIFNWNIAHAISVFITHALGMGAMLLGQRAAA